MIGDMAILLALHDGARRADEAGQPGLASVLDAIVDSLAESTRHASGLRMWRGDEIKAIYDQGSKGARR